MNTDTKETEIEPAPVTETTPVTREQNGFLGFILGLSIICFVLGIAAHEFQWNIYTRLLAPPFASLRAWLERIDSTSAVTKCDLWHGLDYQQRGVIRFRPELAHQGYTVYTSAHEAGARLIDMDGNVVHQWGRLLHDVWSNPPHIPHPVPDPFVHWRRVHVWPNGDLLTIYVGVGDTPWGYGLAKLDKNSELLWSYPANVHHDFDVRADDSVVTLVHEFRPYEEIDNLHTRKIDSPVLDDYIVELSPTGEVLKKISICEAFARSPYRDVLQVVDDYEWDCLHTNSIDLIGPEFAQRHDFAQEGQVLLSLRAREILAIVDLDTEEVVWATFGTFHRQHDAEALANGNLLLFDNRGNPGPGGPTRIIEFDPVTADIAWEFAGDEHEWLYSRTRGAQQLLDNDNILITESDGGRILEVTRDGQIAWEFRNPATCEADDTQVGVICGALRFTPAELNFEFNQGNVSN